MKVDQRGARSEIVVVSELVNWMLVRDIDPFDHAKVRVRLAGQILKDRLGRFADRSWIITSPVRSRRHLIAAGAVVRTHGSTYRLLRRSDREDLELD